MMQLELDIFDMNLPLLLGVDTVDKYELHLDYVDNLLACTFPNWSNLITRKSSHIFYEWDYDILYTERELRRIHRHLYHLHLYRMFNFMKRLGDPEAKQETVKKLFRRTVIFANVWQNSPDVSEFLLQRKILFYRTMMMYLMSIESK